MPIQERNLVISTPGRLPGCAVGFDLPAGHVIDEGSLTVTGDTIGLTAENAEVNDTDLVIDGQTYAAGHAVLFTAVAAAEMSERDADDPAHVLIDYATDLAPTQRLRYRRAIEIYEHIELQ